VTRNRRPDKGAWLHEWQSQHPGNVGSASKSAPKLDFRFRRSIKPQRCYTAPMKVEEIAEAVAQLPPDQLARFRRWFTAFETGRTNHAEELDSAATKLGRLAGRAFAELKRRAKEP